MVYCSSQIYIYKTYTYINTKPKLFISNLGQLHYTSGS